MSVERPPVVPAELAALLAPGAEPEEGFTLMLMTVRPDGWPHLALLSVSEVVALGERDLALALWPASSAARQLAETGRATLAAVAGGASWSLRLAAHDRGTIETALGGRLRRFDAHVEAATSDEAPYAVLEAGIAFRLIDPAAARARWRETRAALAGGADGG